MSRLYHVTSGPLLLPSRLTMSSRTLKRLLSELNDFNSSSSPGLVSLSPVSDDDLLKWSAQITGPEGTPFQGGY